MRTIVTEQNFKVIILDTANSLEDAQAIVKKFKEQHPNRLFYIKTDEVI